MTRIDKAAWRRTQAAHMNEAGIYFWSVLCGGPKVVVSLFSTVDN